jgi:hypothetical protein
LRQSAAMMRSDSRLYRGARGSLYAPEFANTIEAPEGGRLAWIAAVGTSTLTVVGAAGFLKTRLGCHPKSGGDLRMLTRSYREAPRPPSPCWNSDRYNVLNFPRKSFDVWHSPSDNIGCWRWGRVYRLESPPGVRAEWRFSAGPRCSLASDLPPSALDRLLGIK